VLNVAPRAVAQLVLGNREVRFMARFGGVSQAVIVPLGAVVAIYPRETGTPLMLPDDGAPLPADPTDPAPDGGGDGEPPKRSHLRVVK
jgi:stringent starvation protein B